MIINNDNDDNDDNNDNNTYHICLYVDWNMLLL